MSFPGRRIGDSHADPGELTMADVPRSPPEEVRPKVLNGAALLVCAYEDPASFRSMLLEGAISVKDFRERLSSLGKETEIVFYCS